MAWTIDYKESALKQLRKIDKQMADLVTRFMRDRVGTAADPRVFGHALTGDLRGYWRYRVGDFRIITEIHDERLVVLVIAVVHRKDAYR